MQTKLDWKSLLLLAVIAFSAIQTQYFPSVYSQTTTLFPSGDSWIDEKNSNDNHGSDGELKVETKTSERKRTLIRFDISSIPSSATINSAILTLFVDDAPSAQARIHEIHRVTAEWVEDQVTWNRRNSANFWTSAGGDVISPAAAIINTGTVDGVLVNVFITNLVQQWVSGSNPNFGLLLKDTQEPGGTGNQKADYGSREESDPNKRPRLVITFSTTTTQTTTSPTTTQTTATTTSPTTATTTTVTVTQTTTITTTTTTQTTTSPTTTQITTTTTTTSPTTTQTTTTTSPTTTATTGITTATQTTTQITTTTTTTGTAGTGTQTVTVTQTTTTTAGAQAPPPSQAATTTIGDSDGDGILDGQDLCPGTPPNTPVDSRGCPVQPTIDSDGDGIPNSQDQCPLIPGPPPTGCPPSQPPTTVPGPSQPQQPTEVQYTGTVRDANGRPIQGVLISSTTGQSTTTDAAGNWALILPFGRSVTLTASKNGYQFSPTSQQFIVTSPPGEVRFVAFQILTQTTFTGIAATTGGATAIAVIPGFTIDQFLPGLILGLLAILLLRKRRREQ